MLFQETLRSRLLEGCFSLVGAGLWSKRIGHSPVVIGL
ncbi:MAG: hypothetical protein OJF51_000829 [Nitrospira sp.]|nr:MAG: hypothetical protein OJF51_000829 [Nitrospira sp.]